MTRIRICIWTDTGDDYASWDTSCGRAFCMIDDTPKKNDYNFCPGCGGKLVEVMQKSETAPSDEVEHK